MKKLLLLIAAIIFATAQADAQSWLEKLGQQAVDRATERAKQKTEDKVNDKVDKTVDGAFDKAEGAVSGKSKDKSKSKKSGDGDAGGGDESGDAGESGGGKPAAQSPKALESAYAKSDFVPGDVIIFADDLANEKSGEFPSKWDLLNGTAEIAAFQGSNSIYADPSATIVPLMKDMKGYLPDVFTIEFDILIDDPGKQWGTYNLYLHNESFEGYEYICHVAFVLYGGQSLDWHYKAPGSTEDRKGRMDLGPLLKRREWHHVALSFNKRAFKLYLNGSRVINLPSMEAPKRVALRFENSQPEQPFAIKDFRMAQGAVPLYDRMMTDGKIVTYGITFDVGKSTVKPESMTEINRIAQLMKDNPTLKFSVEGHTDSTGNPASNQTLSDARSKAVMDKLIELGIAADRLKAAGKGQSNPIADNSTDEGRAKNRRVEFVKL